MYPDSVNYDVIAIAANDLLNQLHIFHLPETISLDDLAAGEKEEYLVAGKIIFPYKWFKNILACNQEMLDEIQEKL